MSTASLDSVSNKLEIARRAVLDEFSSAVIAVMVIGSITREATEASDLDVSVVFLDQEYNERIEDIREKLRRISAEINARYCRNELTLWATKADHYRTLLPDVSYVRRNLPYSLDRLDAWCGLAKITLAFYEGASSTVIYGTLDPQPTVKIIPRYEAVELFLVATRCLAEGLSELTRTDPLEQRNGVNHLAKAGLRAAYAFLIAKDCLPRNSYNEIFQAASREFPEELQPILLRLYDAKMGVSSSLPTFVELLRVMRYCEDEVAAVRRLTFSGVSWGRAGESFAYPADLLVDAVAPVESYSRFAGFDVNFVHSIYFVLTAKEIVHRISNVASTHPEVLDFFFEEIVAVATFAFFNPEGLSIHIGIHEKTELRLNLGIEALESLVPLLSGLATWYSKLADSVGNRWLERDLRMSLLRTLAMQLSAGPRLGNDDPMLSELRGQLDLDGFCRAAKWQSHLLRGLYSERFLEQQNKLALTLYQAGRIEDSQSIVQEALRIEDLREDLEARLLDGPRVTQLRSLLSYTHQYHGVTLHRKGDFTEAKSEYVRALELGPDNFSALDDLASLLMETAPTEATAQFLCDLVGRTTTKREEARNQIVARFMTHAVDLKQQGRYEEARPWYERTIELDPVSARAHNNFALLLEAMNEMEAASMHYEKAIKSNPKYTNAYIGLGRLVESSGENAKAVQVLSLAIDAGAADERVWTNLGNIHWKNRDLESARNCYEAAISLNSGFADAWNGMGVLLISLDNPHASVLAQALLHFEKAIDSDPSFEGFKANYMKTLGLLLQSKST